MSITYVMRFVFSRFKNVKISRLFVNSVKGFSLIELMITTAILGFVAAAISVLMSRANSQYSELKNKVNFIGYHQLVVSLMNNKDSCDCNFMGKTFTENNSTFLITIPQIKHSCAPNAGNLIRRAPANVTADMVVNDIYVTDIVSTGNSNEYAASLYVKANTPANSVQIKPIPIPFHFHTDPASPSAAKVISGCGKAPLSVPTNLAATAGNAQCSFSWTPSSGAVPIVYNLLRSTTAGQASSGVISCQSTAQTCLVSGLVNDQIYYFAVQATNPEEATAFSSEVSCTPLQPTSVPAALAATPISQNTCRFTWGASSGSPTINYELRSSTVAGQSSSGTLVCSGATNTCDVSGLTTGTTYFFSILARNPAGASPSSGEITCTTFSNASCGAATTWGPSTTAPNSSLCNVGTASAPSSAVGTTNPWSWTCTQGSSVVNCALAKQPLYNTSQFSGSQGQAPCNWYPSISNGTPWGCSCMTGVNTTSSTCSANSFMTHGNNNSACVYTCNLQQTN